MKQFTSYALAFITACLLGFSASANVCNFYVKDCAIKPGETKQIQVYIDNDITIQDWQFQLFLPEGITPIEDEQKEAYFVPQGNAAKASMVVTENYITENKNLRVLAYNKKGNALFTAGGGIIGYITVKASDNFSGKAAIQIIKKNGSSDEWSGNKGDYYTDPDDKSTLVAINSEDITNYIYPDLPYVGQITTMTKGEKYGISDLRAVYCLNGVLYCKDNNANSSKNTPGANEIDYMSSVASLQDAYDQSNWIALKLTSTTAGADLVGNTLNNVFGTVTDASNLVMTVDEDPTADADASYTLNTYIAASFGGTQVSSVNNDTYFFVSPKPMEVANIKWAQWDAANSKFIVPSKNGVAVNGAGLSGSFSVDYSLLSETPSLTDGYVYSMTGVIKNAASASSDSRKKAEAESGYVVSLLAAPTVTKGGTVTGVDDINTANANGIRKVYENGQIVIYNGEVKYNVMGMKIK